MTEPGHVGRRVFALLVDAALASAIGAILTLPFLGDPSRVRLGGGLDLTTRQCSSVTSVPQAWVDAVAPLPLSAAVVCRTRVWGIDNGLSASLTSFKSSGAVTVTRSITLPIDEAGAFVAPVFPAPVIALVVLVIGGGLFLHRTGTTPGKRLLGLRVAGIAGAGRGILREALRFLPWIAGLVLAQMATVAGPGLLPALGGLFFLAIAGSLVLVGWYWLWPLLRWKGATRYDRWLGLTVQRRQDATG